MAIAKQSLNDTFIKSFNTRDENKVNKCEVCGKEIVRGEMHSISNNHVKDRTNYNRKQCVIYYI